MKTRIEDEKSHWNDRYHDDAPDLIYGLSFPPESGRTFWDAILPLSGKTVLEIGCGTGRGVTELADHGATVWGIDISEQAVREAQRRIGHRPNIQMRVADAHRLPFADSEFDVIVGHGVLHHLDLRIVRDELHRCLKPGGVAVFTEPLAYNPCLRLFRWLTPQRRTSSETPLKWGDIRVFEERFIVWHREFFCLTLLGVPLGMLGAKRTSAILMRGLYRAEIILRLNRLFRRYCWMTRIIMTRPALSH